MSPALARRVVAVVVATGCAQSSPSSVGPAGPTSANPPTIVSLEPADEPAPPSAHAPTVDGDAQLAVPEHRLPVGDDALVFAKYLQSVHQRVHPTFADGFLEALNQRPAGDAVQQDAEVGLELVIAGADGRLVRIGVIEPSGVTEFDVGAVTAVQDAAPFPVAPEAIRSFDGNVYIQWKLYRDPFMACSTQAATPLILSK